MTINSSYNPELRPINSSRVYTFNFQAITGTVYVFEVDADGVQTPASNISIVYNGNAPIYNGGQITFNTAHTAGTVNVLITRSTDQVQSLDLQPYSDFPAESVEFSLDRLTLVDQENTGGAGTPWNLQALNKAGIRKWDAETEYAVGEFAIGSDNSVYQALTAQSGNNPVSDTGANWQRTSISDSFTFEDTVADLAASSHAAGVLVATRQYAVNFQGGGSYVVLTLTQARDFIGDPSWNPDEVIDFTIANGNVALLSTNGTLLGSQAGMVGDDNTVNTTAFQAALDYAATRAKVLLIESGTYLTSNVTFKTPIRVYGQSRDTVTLKMTSDVTDRWIRNADISADGTRLNNSIVFQEITFNGENVVLQRWLQNPDTLVAISNPENDYYDAGTNPAGRIGNPSFGADQDGIVLSNTPVGAGSLVLDGALVSGGSVDLTTERPRKVSVTSPGDISGVQFTITGTDEDGLALVDIIAGSNTNTVYSTVAFKTITDVSIDSAPGNSLEVGIREYDIFSAAAEKRRNKNYRANDVVMMGLIKTENTFIRLCRFRNFNGTAISEQGGKNVFIEDNVFNQIGKNDGPYPAIWTQSYGIPSVAPAFYQDSENIFIRRNRAANLERSFCLFAPTKGGVLENNDVEGYGESCIFVGPNLHFNGGKSTIANNRFLNGVLTDIAGNAVEAGQAKDLDIRDNYMFRSSLEAMVLTGNVRSNVVGNVIENCYFATSYPYGPFAERYDFNVNQPPIAGDPIDLATDGSFVRVGSVGSFGCDKQRISGNMFKETRGVHPLTVFVQSKSGSNNIAQRCDITDNVADIPGTMEFFNSSQVTNVWDASIPLTLRGNQGHASEAPVRIDAQIAVAGTGLVTFEPGFRPSAVHVIAANNSFLQGQSWVGFFSWQEGGARNDSGVATGVGSSDVATNIFDPEAIRLVDSTNATQFSAELYKWTEKGFVLNVITASVLTNLRFICYP